jgi:hypothetical protein
LGGWVFDFLPELGAASEVTGTFTEATTASALEVTVKELKQISTGLARMSAMLVGETTRDRATMLHSEFLISPIWRANYQGVRPGQIHKGATRAVVG